MTAHIYTEADAPIDPLKGKKIAVIGYGSQGHAHALNAHDSGLDVMVGLYTGSKSWAAAETAGLQVAEVADATRQADVIVMLIPDEKQRRVFEEHVRPNVKAGQSLVWAHGFNIHFKQIVPPAGVDVWMVAPKAPGHRMRELFVEGKGVPSLVAVEQDATGQAWQNAFAYGNAVGSAKAGLLKTTFKEETETDLFGEQSVLCGGITALIKAGWETLVEAGYQPEVAYYECLNEMKLIVDLMFEGGMQRMRYSISDTAEYGDYISGPRIIDASVKARMREVLTDIQNGTFAHKWLDENEAGRPNFNKFREQMAADPMEKVGTDLRSLMNKQGLTTTTG
ncbi:MAG TPA: ketol-acid reductoisomerase [Chloroflexota bacterium]|jgi:ketol-acid reductoisomerase|nr:ketol-acid reductoisomerase [Chloroflexota bacterium]